MKKKKSYAFANNTIWLFLRGIESFIVIFPSLWPDTSKIVKSRGKKPKQTWLSLIIIFKKFLDV